MVTLTTEAAHGFVVVQPLSDVVVGIFYNIEVAVESVKMSWACELRWETFGNAAFATCMATGQPVAKIVKLVFSLKAFPLAL